MKSVETNKWQTRFGWIWYNEEEIFRFTQEDMDKKVKEFADRGLTILIGFSCTHFRFSFFPVWDKINDCIEKLVRSCHRYGIRYVEHHSSHLTHNPVSEEDQMSVDQLLMHRGTSRKAWQDFDEVAMGEPLLNGKKLSSFRQISGETGKWGRTVYCGYAMCFNNPDYREAYFSYLADLYARGIDGIMTDDVQYFGNDSRQRWNACTCLHCRKLFREKTGYELPKPQDWDKFYDNFDDPVFVAWKRFKYDSTKDFVYAVNEHYSSLGYEMLRPNYIASILQGNITAYPFENCNEIWDYIFQENYHDFIIKDSHLTFAMEAIHRFSMARKRSVPSMSMFYPHTQSTLYFSWALSRAWGQLYTQTLEGDPDRLNEQRYRDFEVQYSHIYENPKKLADLAFMLSPCTRDFTADGPKYMEGFLRWMQASYVSGIGTDLIFEEEPLDSFIRYPFVMCAHTAMLGTDTLRKLKDYVCQGGNLILTGAFGLYDTAGQENASRVAELFEVLPAEGTSKRLGGGTIHVLSDVICPAAQKSLAIPRYLSKTEEAHAQPYSVDALRNLGGEALHQIIGECVLQAECKTEIFLSAFENDAGIALHVVNMENVIAKQGMTSHFAPVPPYTEGAEPIGSIKIRLQCGFKPEKIVFCTPDAGAACEIPFNYVSDLRFTIPGGLFSGYAAVQIFV